MLTKKRIAELLEFAQKVENIPLRLAVEAYLAESPEQIETRRRMNVFWDSDLPLLRSRWHIDSCVYDGEKLKNADIQGIFVGNINFGPIFNLYRLDTQESHEHFEQCPKCNLVYLMGPSPQNLEKLRTYEPAVYRESNGAK